MRKTLGIAAALAILSWGAVVSSQGQSQPGPIFRSAELTTATGVPIPINSNATGMVELRVTVGKTGRVSDVQVVRELASATESSVSAVKKWEFTPATLDGKPLASVVTVSVVVCPYAGGGPASFPRIETGSKDDRAGGSSPLVPAEIVSAQFPIVPNAAVVGGTVVLQVVIGSDGQQGLAKVIQDRPPLTPSALQAVKDWKFTPARLGGQNVRSNIVLAFRYRMPQTSY